MYCIVCFDWPTFAGRVIVRMRPHETCCEAAKRVGGTCECRTDTLNRLRQELAPAPEYISDWGAGIANGFYRRVG